MARRITLDEVARATGGAVRGDGDFVVHHLRSLTTAQNDSLAFYAAGTPRAQIEQCKAGAMLLCAAHADWFDGHKIIVADAYLGYARASELFVDASGGATGEVGRDLLRNDLAGVSSDESTVNNIARNVSLGSNCAIGKNVCIDSGAVIGANAVVGDDCIIGADTHIEAGAVIYPRTHIGARCRISGGAVIGASGFGYARDGDAWAPIQQLGGVRIGDDVDVGANTTIDRGALDDTIIGDGVKLDNLIQIGHNVQIGEHTIMASGVAVAGSTVIGKRCQFGGRAAAIEHLHIADDVVVQANSVVAKSILEAGVYSAMITAQPVAMWRKTAARLRRIDSLARQIKTLAEKIK